MNDVKLTDLAERNINRAIKILSETTRHKLPISLKAVIADAVEKVKRELQRQGSNKGGPDKWE